MADRIIKDTCKHNRAVDEECLDCRWNAAIEEVIKTMEHSCDIVAAKSNIRKLKK
jgi:hypothetical protein